MGTAGIATHREPWNKGKIVGQKAPFKPKDIWALRVLLQIESRVRELALFNLGIDSKLRGRDLVALRVRDVCHGDQLASVLRDYPPSRARAAASVAYGDSSRLPQVSVQNEVGELMTTTAFRYSTDSRKSAWGRLHSLTMGCFRKAKLQRPLFGNELGKQSGKSRP
jgi:hypothetical protein